VKIKIKNKLEIKLKRKTTLRKEKKNQKNKDQIGKKIIHNKLKLNDKIENQ